MTPAADSAASVYISIRVRAFLRVRERTPKVVSGITINGNEERRCARARPILPSETEEPERWEVNEGDKEESIRSSCFHGGRRMKKWK